MTNHKTDGSGLSWMRSASCLGMDTEMFFPPSGVNVSAGIKALCNACPVNMECYEYAVKHGLDMGIFGGTSAIERIRTRRRRTKATA
jgi:WhiB family redox-sensing transcriptional regulator